MHTGIIKMSQRQLLAYLFRHFGKIWVIVMTVMAVGLAAIAIILSDLRYAILAMMIVFIIFPAAMAFLYFNYALKPDISFNILSHRIKLTPSSLEIEIYPYYKSEEKKKKNKSEEKEDSENKNEKFADLKNKTEDCKEIYDNFGDKTEDWNGKDFANDNNEDSKVIRRSFPLTRLGRYQIGLDDIVISLLKDSDSAIADGFIYIPVAAFGNVEELQHFLTLIYDSKSYINPQDANTNIKGINI